jgi:hypothetical protein
MSGNRDKFWLDDFTVLYENNNFLRFLPTPNGTQTEQLNATTRLMIYFIILILLFEQNEELLYIPIGSIVLIVLIYNIYANKNDKIDNYSNEEPVKIKYDNVDMGEELDIDSMNNSLNSGNSIGSDISVCGSGLSNDLSQEGIYDIESGYVDSENDIITGREYRPYTMDEMIDCERSRHSNSCMSNASGCASDNCREPTLENPFMNPNITEFNTDDAPPVACNAEDEDIKDNVRVNFNHNLFRDLDDVFERENSQRQFYTTPNTGVPNNQVDGFAHWLWGDMPSGKEGQFRGSIYTPYWENLKYAR